MGLLDDLARAIFGGGEKQEKPQPGFLPQGKNTTIYGAATAPGVQVEEDAFQFPTGGQFERLPDGRAYINGGMFPRGQFEEDAFTFPTTRTPRITGAQPPIRGIYSPGEGPRTRF